MILFILLIASSFGGVGLAIRSLDKEQSAGQLFLWGMGAALFAHVASYISVSYFHQNMMNWYLLLAMIASISAPWARESAARKHASKTSLPGPVTSEVGSVAQAELTNVGSGRSRRGWHGGSPRAFPATRT